jgi:hypothetical protein
MGAGLLVCGAAIAAPACAHTQKIEVQLFRGVETWLFVGAAVLATADVLGRFDDALLNPAIERPGADAVTLGLDRPRLTALSRVFSGWLVKNRHDRPSQMPD